MHSAPHESAAAIAEDDTARATALVASIKREFLAPPATGGTLYYPAQKRGKFPSVQAALASIGCTGEAARSAIAQARVNASPAVAVPVKFAPHPGDDFAAVIVRTPGGKATLYLGCLSVADEDREFAEDAARQFAEASGDPWAVFTWTRQSGALQ